MSLPKGYKRLEYIQSSGTQYVDTGFKPNQDTRVVMDCQAATLSTGGTFPFGERAGLNSKAFAVALTTTQVFYNYATTYKFADYANPYERMTIDANKNVCTFTGSQSVSISLTAGAFTSSNKLLVGTWGNNGSASTGDSAWSGKIYSCQIYDNGTLVRDFIPCQNDDGEIGLWDDVNSLFYGNVGTGTFTAGPEVVIALDPPASVEQVLSVKLAWSAVENASFYRVYRDGVQIGETEGLTYADDTAEFGQTYRYGITACSGSSESDPTELTVYTREGYAVIRPVVTSANFL